MAEIIRYRTGINGETGQPLRGLAHVIQSLHVIWTTRTNSLVMLLDYGSDLRSLLGQDITPELVLNLYKEMIASAHRWESEARIDRLQLVYLTKMGQLGMEYGGQYYPEGRFGNYAIVEELTGTMPIADRQRLARAIA